MSTPYALATFTAVLLLHSFPHWVTGMWLGLNAGLLLRVVLDEFEEA